MTDSDALARQPQQVEDNVMIHIPNPSVGRRGLIAGAAGLLAAAPIPVLPQVLSGGLGGGQSP